jgi:hypothetical protein
MSGFKILGAIPGAASPMPYTEDWNAALTSTYQLITTTTTATRSLRMSAACNASAYDIEYQVVASGAGCADDYGPSIACWR